MKTWEDLQALGDGDKRDFVLNAITDHKGSPVYNEAKIAYEYYCRSKNAIVNIRSIDHLSPEFNGRFVARLKNGEDIIISRGYVPDLKKKLGIGR